MTLSATYDELTRAIASRYGRRVELSYVSPQTVALRLPLKVLFASTGVRLQLSVLSVEGRAITLSYDGSAGVDMIISGALKIFKNRLAKYAHAVSFREGRIIILDLARVDKAAPVLEAVDLRAVTFSQDGIILTADLR